MASTLNDGDHHKQKSLDQEVREMISSLTNRLGNIQRSSHKSGGGPGPHSHGNNDDDHDDDKGVRIITLAGTNIGATMRGEMDEKNGSGPQDPTRPKYEEEDFATYVNSNFQAINNSIMFGGTYATNDPGVHLDISDYYRQRDDDDDDDVRKNRKKVRKNNKKGGGIISNKSDRVVGHSDKSTTSDDDERS